ncbi:hypothetical protein LTR08_002014 [Meristemomyces frigidus]|nr:hypothetical protein LTR08_002014 [Meristemomyces frigidus]
MSANLSNWRESPHNVWAFHNIDKILPTKVVSTSETEPSPLKANPQSFDGFKIQLGSSPELGLAGYEKYTETDGLVVLHKGKVVHEYYDHGNEPSSRHILMSLTKSVTGLVTGILASQGALDVTKPINHYLPETSSLFANVTIQHCLDMNTGVTFEDGNHEYRAAGGWNPLRGDEPHTTLHAYLTNAEAPTAGPGVGFNYTSLNTDLLGMCLERITGKQLPDLISALLWQPLGAESDAFMPVDGAGSARAAGAFCATVRDLARVGQLVADGGRGIVPASWLEDMQHGGSSSAFAAGSWAPAFTAEFSTLAYRDCWLADSESGICFGLGIHGQMLMVDRVHDVVMAKTSSQANPTDFGAVKLSVRAFKEMTRILLLQS